MLFTRLFSTKREAYSILKLPIKYSYLNPIALRENSEAAWKAYRSWFFSEKSTRIQELELEIRRKPGYQNWSADFSGESVASLSAWFQTAVHTRKPTRAEITWIFQNILPGPGRDAALQYMLSEKTASLCFDIGMYLGDAAISTNPLLKWKKIEGKQAWAGMMAITGELRHKPNRRRDKNFPIEPVSRVRVIAARIVEDSNKNESGSANLREMFEVILNTFEPADR